MTAELADATATPPDRGASRDRADPREGLTPAAGELEPRPQVRVREVRPTWSAREWTTVSTAAAAAGMAPATWASQVVVGGLIVDGERPVPPRCTPRALLWGQVLERWQSVSWAIVALRERTDHGEWARASQVVGRAGVVITTQADTLPGVERTRAAEASLVATESMTTIGPGARGSSRHARRGEQAGGGHRAKVLFTPADHQTLQQTCHAAGWTVSDYVAAVTTLAAWLALTGSDGPYDIALLVELLDLARATASDATGLLAAPAGDVDPARWQRFTRQVAEVGSMVDAARARQPSPNPEAGLATLVPRAYVALGWAAAWGVHPQ